MTKFRESELLAKKVSGTLSPEEQAELEQWEQASETHRRLSEKVASPDFIRQAAENHKGEAMRSWEKMRRRLPRGRRSPYLRTTVRRWTAIAASLALVAGIATLSYLHPWMPPTTLEPGTEKAVVRYASGASEEVSRPLAQARLADFRKQGRPTVIEVPRGGEYTLTLPDCTVVHLNAGSSLEIPADFSNGRRRVRLYGEAFFKVAHDERAPFYVETDRLKVRVLGTEFNFRNYRDEEAHVSLVKGSVEVMQPGTDEAAARLQPGQDACWNEAGQVVDVHAVDTFAVTQWVQGFFYFDDAPLKTILREVGRWYNLGVVFRNAAYLDYRVHFSASRNEEVEQLVDYLNRLRKFKVRKEGVNLVVE